MHSQSKRKEVPMEKQITVVFAEDSATQSAKLQYFLESNDFNRVPSRNGLDALRNARECHPDLIVSDVVMPEMDGYEFCRAAKADPALREIPFILLTSLGDARDVIQGLQCGADNFITKPYD